jgi:hypothetical protein
LEETPIFTTRAVVDAGGMMTGGAAHVGSDGVSAVTRSATSCLACRMSVPGSNCSSMDDNCGTDLERTRCSPSRPLSDCSSGTLTSCSTSAAFRPLQIVWISTRGGANSGKASIGISRNCCTPKNIIAAPAKIASSRNFTLELTIQRINAPTLLV